MSGRATKLRWPLNEATLPAFPMLTVSQLTKSFGGRILFEDVSLQVNRGDRVGLVGPNGAGKSTLFSLVLEDALPDKGRSRSKNRNNRISAAGNRRAGDETVLELACRLAQAFLKAQRSSRKQLAGS